MAEMRFTLPGTSLPDTGPLPPTLLFHRWQAYDRFEREPETDREGAPRRDPRTGEQKWLEAFSRNDSKIQFLERIARNVQASCSLNYGAWHLRFSNAFEELAIEPVRKATTLWRLVVGWGTNPAFETGITLDPLLGFPFMPGSAVKGLLHRVAEQELLEADGGEPALPSAPDFLPPEPPPDLQGALVRACRVRALFGFLHLRSEKTSDPEAPFDRLLAWREIVANAENRSDAWTDVRRQLDRLCSDAPAGGMVTCFDAVPANDAFSGSHVLTPDVLTPHPVDAQDDRGPNPIPFLAVRDGVTFELRYRLAAFPKPDPRDHRDEQERERAADLGGAQRQALANQLERWLVRGLAELGLGGKTAAGYGYLVAEGTHLPYPTLRKEPPPPVAPAQDLSAPEHLARLALPEGIAKDPAIAALDRALRETDPKVQTAVAARFKKLYPETVESWRSSQKAATRKRVETIDRLLGGGKESEP